MFKYKKGLRANSGRVILEFTLKDSATFTIGDALKLASGKLDLAGAGASVAGILMGFVKSDGQPLLENGASGDFVNTYTSGASNTVKGQIDISKESIYSVTADATLGTTTGSDLAGYYMDCLATSDQLDESTAAATAAQFISYGEDPDADAPDNSVLVSIFESQFFGPLAA